MPSNHWDFSFFTDKYVKLTLWGVNMYRRYFKRPLDLAVALFLLIILSPLLLFIAILIKIEKPREPIFFKQKRIGRGGIPFTVYKFRTMISITERNNKKISNGKRLTKVGNLLRKTSVDELPQLINIIKGEMSFIGPRPLLPKYLPFYTKREFQRHNVLPGISGLAQINGRNALDWDERFQYDIEYVNQVTFKMDLKILFLTIHRIFARSNVLVDSLPDLDIERRA